MGFLRQIAIATTLAATTLTGLASCDSPSPEVESPPDSVAITYSDSDPAAQPALENSWAAEVVPGQQVGPVTATTSRDQLAEIFGEAALEDADIHVGEGFTEPGTRINADSDQAFTIVWQDQSRQQPLLARDFGSAWQTPEGLGVGSDLAQLKQALGAFQLYGFGWDYEGTVILEGSELDRYHGDLFLRLRPSPEAATAHAGAYEAMLGDGVFASEHPSLETLEPEVYAMVVYLNPLEE